MKTCKMSGYVGNIHGFSGLSFVHIKIFHLIVIVTYCCHDCISFTLKVTENSCYFPKWWIAHSISWQMSVDHMDQHWLELSQSQKLTQIISHIQSYICMDEPSFQYIITKIRINYYYCLCFKVIASVCTALHQVQMHEAMQYIHIMVFTDKGQKFLVMISL